MSRLTCCLMICAWTAATLSVAAPADGETAVASSANSILVTASVDRLNSGVLGSNASLDWIHSASLSDSQATRTLGVAVYSVGDSRWSFGKLGAAYGLNDSITVQGELSAGGGKTAGHGFGYQVYDGSVAAKADPRFYLRLGHQFYRIAGSSSHLLKPGVVLVPSRRLQADLTYARSISGNVGSQFFSGRMDYSTRAVDWLGGLSLGNSTPQNLNLEIGRAPREQRFYDVFMGVTFRLPQSDLTVIADFLSTQPGHRSRFTIGWKVPIGTLDRSSNGK